jgi:uncharacterized membrane protein
MIWRLLFRFREYWVGNLWIIPALFAVAGCLGALGMVSVDKSLADNEWFQYDAGTATSILSALLSATITFTGFVFTMLLLVPQFSGSQLSARVLHLIYRDPKQKLIFGLLLGTMIYVFTLMIRMRGGFIPGLSLWFAGILVFSSILIFLGFVSYFVQHLRPATAAASVAQMGRKVIDNLYHQRFTDMSSSNAVINLDQLGQPVQVVRRSGKGGVILAVSNEGLLQIAKRHDCLIVVRHAVGDYIAAGEVLADIYGAVERDLGRAVNQLIALGTERTFEQDPLFSLRILVDISAKALSPAINDPTTAVNVIDHIEDLLMLLAQRDLAIGHLRDRQNHLRVVLPSWAWEEFLLLAVTEIRLYSGSSIQVIRRLGTMLKVLADAVPAAYVASIDTELLKLEQTIERNFPDEADRARARSLLTASVPHRIAPCSHPIAS